MSDLEKLTRKEVLVMTLDELGDITRLDDYYCLDLGRNIDVNHDLMFGSPHGSFVDCDIIDERWPMIAEEG